MVEVRHREHDAQLATQFQQDPQEGYRIRATGHGHAHAVSSAHQGQFADMLEDLLAHEAIVRQGRLWFE
jgi:hypothetical protein